MSPFEKLLLLVNIGLYSFLTIFSYSYVDLNLTLSKNQLINSFVTAMQQLGYFNRPAASLIYLSLIVLLFSFFILNLWLFYRKKISLQYLKVSAITNTLILILAYPLLSSDLFNYLFDAKIILNYHVSPYTHRPLDFPNDEWLRFMRWIHRYSPYGPLWLGFSVIPAALGFGKFILNFLAFKIFIGIFHLVNTYLIFKILQKINPQKILLGTAFYALNPLFLIEGVANAHNDMVLATFLIGSIYLATVAKTTWSYLTLLAGTLVKYIPILNLPWLFWFTFGKNKQSFSANKNIKLLIILNLVTMAIFTYLFSSFRLTVPFVSSGATQVQFQPWYLLWTLPLVALLVRFDLILLSIFISFGASLRYLPFLYFGDWSHPGTIVFMQLILLAPLVVALSLLVVQRIFFKFK